jgi:hypothetical protein
MGNNPTSQYPIQRISSAEMCKRFNDGGYWEKVKSGTLSEVVLESCISKLLQSETVEIISEMVSYRDHENNEIARVHQFRRPDGSIAASGRPDPKRLLENGILYRLEKKQKGHSL